MKPRLPLYARFLGWFLLNLLLLAAIFGIVIGTEFRLDTLISNLAGERVQQVADLIFDELRRRPRTEWNEALARYQEAFGVDFALLDERYDTLAGTPLTIPDSIRERMRQGPGPRTGPRPDERRPPPGEPGPGDGPRRFAGAGGRPDFGPPRTFLRVGDPPSHWVVIPGILENPGRGRPTLGRLVIRSTSLSGGGLFIDFTPWWLAGGAVVAISALWWMPFVGSITRSVGQMTSATEQIAEGRFDVAVNERRSDELGRLGGAINRMAGRLSGFVTGQKRFLGDIAHELCSPLARMEMALGVLDQRASPEQREYLQDVRDEVRHMSGLVNELLMFSKAGLKPKEASFEDVALEPLVQEVIAREDPGGDAVQVQVQVPADLTVRTDRERISRALGNLVRNAVRYAGHAGPILVTVTPEGDRVLLSVIDEGPGVPEEALARLGEPFYRPDLSRGRETGGTGLGLAIVRSCVEGCRGQLILQNRKPKGFQATLSLPRTG